MSRAHARDASHESELEAAADRVLADVDAVRDHDVERINRDVDAMAKTVRDALVRIAPLRAQLDSMPNFDVDRLHRLGDYVTALVRWRAAASAPAPTTPMPRELIRRAYALRERTLVDLDCLVRHGVLPGDVTGAFGGSSAHRKVADDLIGLAKLVRDRWPELQGKTLITLEAMDEADRLGREIRRRVADRGVLPADAALAALRTKKAYTLVVRTYDDLRHAIAFLRRAEGDAESFAPTLYVGRSRRPKRANEARPD